jgi:hypothetical protein
MYPIAPARFGVEAQYYTHTKYVEKTGTVYSSTSSRLPRMHADCERQQLRLLGTRIDGTTNGIQY